MFLAVRCTITGCFRVCHNKRITRNKMFRDYAERGKSTWLSRKKTYSNTVPMGRMLLTPSTSGVRSSHRRTYHLWLLILEESCNQKERHSCRSFDLTIIIYYLFFIVPFLSTQHAELPQHSTFIKICPTYLVNNFSVLYKDNHIAIVFQ